MSGCAFGVLGPLQIAGQAPELPRQAQVLLGVLLLRANEIVSPLRLSDEIWGEQPPASGTNAVQVYVSRLRKTIDAAGVEAAIARHPGGYALEVDSNAVDWLLFTSTLQAATRAHASEAGEVWRRLGDGVAAALEHAAALYEQKGNIVAASRVNVMRRALTRRRVPKVR